MQIIALLAAEGPNGKQLPSDINEVYWGSAAFVVLVFFIVWKAGPAIKKGLASRTARIEAELADAESARREAEAALNASTAELPDVGAEADRIRAEATETAARLKEDLIARAGSDAEALKARGQADIENAKRQALADLREEVGRLTRGAAEQVVTESLDDAAHADLIENYINQVGQS